MIYKEKELNSIKFPNSISKTQDVRHHSHSRKSNYYLCMKNTNTFKK